MIELKGKYNKDCKIFVDEIEESCYPTIQNILDSKVSKDIKVRIMPDCHNGKGIVIGFTMPLTDMVNPEHIGVDIGCSVLTAKIKSLDNLIKTHGDLDKALTYLDNTIRNCVPMGTNYHKKTQTKLDFNIINNRINEFHKKWCSKYETFTLPNIDEKYIRNLLKKIGMDNNIFHTSLGTLGGGEMIAIRIG